MGLNEGYDTIFQVSPCLDIRVTLLPSLIKYSFAATSLHLLKAAHTVPTDVKLSWQEGLVSW